METPVHGGLEQKGTPASAHEVLGTLERLESRIRGEVGDLEGRVDRLGKELEDKRRQLVLLSLLQKQVKRLDKNGVGPHHDTKTLQVRSPAHTRNRMPRQHL
jgi:hypothetical protein